jgi:hypothetical protein
VQPEIIDARKTTLKKAPSRFISIKTSKSNGECANRAP